MMSIILRVPKDLHTQFKNHCTKSNTTMSNVLIDYITTLLSKSEEVLPGKEKNSVKKTTLVKSYHCPYCGIDITDASGSDKLFHLRNCKDRCNE